MGRLISEKYAAWQAECEERFQQLKKNEEELNRIFIDIYGLQDELTPDVADKDVTVHRVFDSKDDAVQNEEPTTSANALEPSEQDSTRP